MQELSYQVKTTKDFLFKPTTIEITIRNVIEKDGVKIFPINTRLIQITEKGSIIETANLEFTKEQVDAVLVGYDFELNKPKTDSAALSSLLALFNIELDGE